MKRIVCSTTMPKYQLNTLYNKMKDLFDYVETIDDTIYKNLALETLLDELDVDIKECAQYLGKDTSMAEDM